MRILNGVCMAIFGAASLSAIPLGAQRGETFRASIDLISLPVTVTGTAGRRVTDLTVDDFEIFEDGRLQEPAFFSLANTALSVSLLLDSSSSMEGRMPLAQKAATQFVAGLRPNDVAQIVNFDSRVEVLQPFTSNRALLELAIQRPRAGGSTALYNAVYITLREFEKMRGHTVGDELRREVIVVLSDGEDTSSLVTFDEVLDVAKRSQTVIYTIGLALDDPLRPGRPTPANGEFALRRLAQETGGRLFLPKRPEDLSDVYSRIADELTSQYMLGYLSRNERRDGNWRSVAVRVKRVELQARTRLGYYAANR